MTITPGTASPIENRVVRHQKVKPVSLRDTSRVLISGADLLWTDDKNSIC